MNTATQKAFKIFGAAYRKATKLGATGDECCVCGKQTDSGLFVAYKDQGEYPIGPDCAEQAKKAGLEVVEG